MIQIHNETFKNKILKENEVLKSKKMIKIEDLKK